MPLDPACAAARPKTLTFSPTKRYNTGGACGRDARDPRAKRERSSHAIRFFASSGCVFLAARELPAQQATVRTPFNNVSSGFFEQTGVNWSGHWGGIQFQFGNPGLANPTAGNFIPGAGLSTNFGITGKNFEVNFGFSTSQGYRQSLVDQTPVVTLTNGLPGFVSDTSQSPFVIGQVPVVGNLPMAGPMNPLAVMDSAARCPRRQLPVGGPWPAAGIAGGKVASSRLAQRLFAAQESSAGRAAPSVAEARRLHELEKAADQADLNVLMERARTAEEEGKPGVAKIYYQMIAKRASGDLKSQAQQRLAALKTTPAR